MFVLFSVCFPFLMLTFFFFFVCMFGVCVFCLFLCVHVWMFFFVSVCHVCEWFLVFSLVGVKPFPFAAVWLSARQFRASYMSCMTPHAQQHTHTQCNTAPTHKARQHIHTHSCNTAPKQTHTTLQTQLACSCSCWWSWKRPVLEKTKSWKRLGLGKDLPAGAQGLEKPWHPGHKAWKSLSCPTAKAWKSYSWSWLTRVVTSQQGQKTKRTGPLGQEPQVLPEKKPGPRSSGLPWKRQTPLPLGTLCSI